MVFDLHAVARRFKNSLHENAKSHAMIEDIIEACHNNVETWDTGSQVQPILLRGQGDHVKTRKRWKVIKDYFLEKRIEYQDITSVKGDISSKLINLIYLLDYTTIYRVIISKIDPTPTKSINFVKDIM